MIRIILSLFLVSCVVTAFAQPFGNDVTVNNIGNRRKMEIATAGNGWLFAVHFEEDLSGNYHQMTMQRSIDGGLTWTLLGLTDDLNINVMDFDLIVLGNTSGDIRVNLATAQLDLTTGEYYLLVTRYDGNTGAEINISYAQTTGLDPIRSIAIAADNVVPSTTSPSTTVAVAFTRSAPAADTIIFVGSNNGGVSYIEYSYVAITSEFIREIDLDYGRGATSTWARFYLVYESLPNISASTGNIYYTNQVLGFGGAGWLAPTVNLTSNIENSGLCRNPRIAVQRSTTDNSSGSNTVVVLVERDPTGTNANSDVIGFVNSAPQTTNTWSRLDAEVSPDYVYASDIEYDNIQERFVSTYYNFTNGSLSVAGISRNILPTDAWLSIATNVNDLGLNTLAPKSRIVVVPQMNKIGVCWIEEGSSGNGEIHYDQQGLINNASIASIEKNQLKMYPIPAQDLLHVEFNSEMDLKSASILTMNGQVIQTIENLANKVNTFNVSNLESGIYLLQFKSNQEIFNKYFIKN